MLFSTMFLKYHDRKAFHAKQEENNYLLYQVSSKKLILRLYVVKGIFKVVALKASALLCGLSLHFLPFFAFRQLR